MYNEQEREEAEFRVSSEAEVDQFEARSKGELNPDQAWILSDRDVWYANPFYEGEPQPHPEDFDYPDPKEPTYETYSI